MAPLLYGMLSSRAFRGSGRFFFSGQFRRRGCRAPWGKPDGQGVGVQRPSRAVRAAQRPFRQSGDFVIGGRKANLGRDARTGAGARVVSPAVSPYVFQRKGRAHTLYPTLSAFMPSGYDGTIIHNKMVHNCEKKPPQRLKTPDFLFLSQISTKNHSYEHSSLDNFYGGIAFSMGRPRGRQNHGERAGVNAVSGAGRFNKTTILRKGAPWK